MGREYPAEEVGSESEFVVSLKKNQTNKPKHSHYFFSNKEKVIPCHMQRANNLETPRIKTSAEFPELVGVCERATKKVSELAENEPFLLSLAMELR